MTMYAMNVMTWSSSPAVGWNTRRPDVEECLLVDREVSYADACPDEQIRDGDYVVEVDGEPEAREHLARAFELLGMCDAAHVIPAGVYLEE
jgi:hypothetical protein